MGSRLNFSLSVNLIIGWLHDFSLSFLIKDVGIIIVSSLLDWRGLNDIRYVKHLAWPYIFLAVVTVSVIKTYDTDLMIQTVTKTTNNR